MSSVLGDQSVANSQIDDGSCDWDYDDVGGVLDASIADPDSSEVEILEPVSVLDQIMEEEEEEEEDRIDEQIQGKHSFRLVGCSKAFPMLINTKEALEKSRIKFKIRVPPRGVIASHSMKRKRVEDNSEPEDFKDAQPEPVGQKTPKRKANRAGSSARDEQIDEVKPPQKKRGRPAKQATIELQPVTAPKRCGRPVKVVEDPRTRKFSISVYVEVAQPPVMIRGRTYKGDKLKTQAPITEGPFTMTHGIKWSTSWRKLGMQQRSRKRTLIRVTVWYHIP
jgi:hypothetical protein